MVFPPKAFNTRRFQASSAQYMVEESVAASPDIRYKLATLVDRSRDVKLAYRQLQSQIEFGLVEAAEIFESVAIPLMKLVGLKTLEMESEGRTSTFIFKTERYHMDTAQNGSRSRDLNTEIRNSKEENYAAKAESAGNEILHKNKGQLRQLVHMLRHIEKDVNSHREDILQKIENRRTFLQDLIQKALYYLSSIHRANDDTFPFTVKFLRVLYSNIDEVLGSVDSGVNDLMQALAKSMCYPMTNYVGNLAAEIKLGPCVQLMNVVNEMERANSDTKRELQDAKKRIRIAEETKIDALLRLKKAEEQVRRMKTNSDRFLLPASQEKQEEHSVTGKRMGIEESRENEEKLLWKLLGKRRKQQEPESPMGPKELIRQADTTQKSLVNSRRMTRSQTRVGARPEAFISLGLSPSTRTMTRSRRYPIKSVERGVTSFV